MTPEQFHWWSSRPAVKMPVVKKPKQQFTRPIFALSLLYSFSAIAVHDGISGFSGKQVFTCNSCHAGLDYQSNLVFNGTLNVTPGSLNDITLALSFTAPDSVTTPHAGINIAVSDNGGELIAGDNMESDDEELVQDFPVGTSGTHDWIFQWQAPTTEGEVTLYACSQVVNRDSANGNDDNDTACLVQQITVQNEAVSPVTSATADIDNDGRADFAIWRPGKSTFYTKSSNSLEIVHRATPAQQSYDEPLFGDVNGNGIADIVSWNADSGVWSVIFDDNSTTTFRLGQSGDYPFLLDRDGDGLDDPIVRRPSEGKWYYLASADNYAENEFTFGCEATDIPVPGYYDSDNIADFAIWRNGDWYMRWSTDNINRKVTLGLQETDIKVPADYDGDGITDTGIWRPSNGTWYIHYSSGVYPEGGTRYDRVFGKQDTDIPAPADYDGDGKADLAIRRPGTGEFIYLSSESDQIVKENFGSQSTDIPVMGAWQLKRSMLDEITPSNSSSGSDVRNFADINGDGQAEFLSWRPQTQSFSALSPASDTTVLTEQVGTDNTDIPLTGFINDNDLADVVTFNASSGVWLVRYDDGSTAEFQLGMAGDIPFLLDRDGDGLDDFIVRRPSDGTWYFLLSGSNYSQSSFAFGRYSSDKPVPGYYDQDNLADFAIWRDGTWYVRWTTDNVTRRDSLGAESTDVLAPADFDGDGLTDKAWWRPSTGNWSIEYSSDKSGLVEGVFGKRSTDMPIPADYDGDGMADLAIRRASLSEFIYSSSESGQTRKFEFADQESDIPVLAAWDVKQALVQTESNSNNELSAEEYYTANISTDIVQSRCIACHASGGAADGLARLTFVDSNTENYQSLNQQAFTDLLANSDVDVNYILSKASGGQGHVGGTQIAVGSDEYDNLSTWLNLIADENSSGNGGSEDFWEGATFLSPEQTLRRAAIILSGDLPSEETTVLLGNASDAEFQAAVLNLMQGDAFHDYLVRGANDRLLTDKWLIRYPEALDPEVPFFPAAVEFAYADESGDPNNDAFWSWFQGYGYGMARAPSELIAYIVENDHPYTEVLTADYTMLNRYTNFGFGGTASFSGTESVNEFKPGQIQGVMIMDEGFDAEYTENGLQILSEGSRVNWPHSGVLSDLAWLSRYPTTATNRNRARSRWTYYHFLDFDIEKSAARTQDPDALMDRNNPTLNNPNCTVCHQTLDPVAGTYQLYGNNGWYRDQYGGVDSLPETYKENVNSPYQDGDTWFRTMLSPGFEGTTAPTDQDSVQWLGQQIIADPRFARSAVKFWWHSLMGTAPLDAPTDSSDANYAENLAAYEEQSRFITDVAENLESHWNMKQTLAELVMSSWFRVDGSSQSDNNLNIGTERLLTPEELDQKTYRLTGVAWDEEIIEEDFISRTTALSNDYNIMYGGIDSDGVTNRAEEMTSVMSQIAITHATELSCPVVLQDFARPDEQRLLFDGVSKLTNVFAAGAQTHNVIGKWYESRASYDLPFSADAANYQLDILFQNHYWNEATNGSTQLIIDHILVQNGDGMSVLDVSGADALLAGNFTEEDCGGVYENESDNEDQPSDLEIWRECGLRIPVQIDTSDNYTLSVDAYYVEWDNNGAVSEIDNTRAPEMVVSMSLPTATTETLPGADLLRNKLVELHSRLLGEQLSADSAEIDIALNLFISSARGRAARNSSPYIYEDGVECDINFELWDDPENDIEGWDLLGYDPFYNLSGWRAVMAYLLSDYKYLHE